MPNSLLDLNVNPKQIAYRPEGEPAIFDASVTNRSDRFASFQIDLNAMGIEDPTGEWYRVEPEISAKIPPGDRSHFQVVLVGEKLQEQLALEQERDAAASGTVDLEVRAISFEIDGGEARERLRLAIEPSQKPVPLSLKLWQQDLRGKPEERVEIRLEVGNPSYYQYARASVELLGLSTTWFPDGVRQTVTLAPREQTEVTFICQLPASSEAIANIYPFTVRATHTDGEPSETAGTLEVLLINGNLNLRCPKAPIKIPAVRPWLPRRRPVSEAVEIEVQNVSNAIAPLQVRSTISQPQKFGLKLDFEPSPAELTLQPSTSGTVKLTIHAEKRSWWRRRRFAFPVEAKTLENDAIGWAEEKDVQVIVHPKIPIWLNALGLASLLGLGYYVSWLDPYSPFYYHSQAVNSVEFNGRGTDFISGSDDTQVIEWDLQGFRQVFVRPDRQEIATTAILSLSRGR